MLRISRTSLESGEAFVRELRAVRDAARQRALLPESAPSPLPLLPLDQAEELVSSSARPDAHQLLELAREGMQSGELLVVATIRTETYALLQNAVELANLHQKTLSLGPVLAGEIASVIREPARVLRAKAGPQAPTFSASVIDALQQEMADEPDALPLLAFAMERLMREHAATAEIGEAALLRTGGVARAIEDAAEAALQRAGAPDGPAARRELLRSLFIPALAGINRNTQLPERRVAARSDVVGPSEAALVDALLQERLLVSKGTAGESTIEVAHESLLRRWPALVGLLDEEKQPLLLLDALHQAAADWNRASVDRRAELLIHRGHRLTEAEELLTRRDFQKEIGARDREYLATCRRLEDEQAGQERERQRREGSHVRSRRVLQAIAAALTLIVAAALVVYRSTEAARLASETANSVELGARAEILAEKEPAESMTALALGIRAAGVAIREGLAPSPQARRGLIEAYKASLRSFPLTQHALSSRAARDQDTSTVAGRGRVPLTPPSEPQGSQATAHRLWRRAVKASSDGTLRLDVYSVKRSY